MTLTDKLLKRSEPVALMSSFLYVSDAKVGENEKEQWIAFIEDAVKEEDPDFVFFANSDIAEKVDITCSKATVDSVPLFVYANGLPYAVIGDGKDGNLQKEPEGKDSILVCAYGGCKHDYAIKENGIWYMNTSSSEMGGIRKVSITAEGEVISQVRYFADKKELLYKSNWKTVLFGRGGRGRPLASDDGVYIPTSDDGVPKRCGIYKLDAKGGILWKFSTENSVNSDLAQTATTVMAIDCEGRVYFIGKDGSGLKGSLQLPYEGRYANVETAYHGNMAYVSLKGQIFAVDMEKQTIVWTHGGEGCKTSIPVLSGKYIYCNGKNGLYVLCSKTGEKLWETSEIITCAKPLTLVGGRLLMPCGDKIHLLDEETGKTLAALKVDGVCFDVPSQPLLRGKTAYFGTVGRGVVAIDVSSLTRAEDPQGTFDTEIETSYPLDCGEKTVIGDLMYIDGYIAYSTSDGFTYMTNVQTGANRKNLDTLSSVSSSPTFIYVKKKGKNAMEAYLVTSSLSGKIFGNRL